MRLTVAAMIVGMILANHANAQNVLMINNGNRAIGGSGQPQTVTITFNLVLPAPAVSSSEDMTKAMAATTQSLYDIVNHECDVLTAALKGDCRLSKLNIGGNFNDANLNVPNFGNRPNAGPIVNANATATFEIEMKASPAPVAAAPPATPNPPKK
jgi:hypothetical protein